jgi:hypothetical protein
MIEADRWFKGEVASESKIGRLETYHIMDLDILGQLNLKDLYEFSLIADSENAKKGQKEGFVPALVWVFRRNGHAILHYRTLTNREQDSTCLRANQIRRRPNILSGYTYKLAFDRPGFIFRTQPILLPTGHFYWENLIRKISDFIKPALDEKGRFLRAYDSFKTVFGLSTDAWWQS